jgi:hypothetical protein
MAETHLAEKMWPIYQNIECIKGPKKINNPKKRHEWIGRYDLTVAKIRIKRNCKIILFEITSR